MKTSVADRPQTKLVVMRAGHHGSITIAETITLDALTAPEIRRITSTKNRPIITVEGLEPDDRDLSTLAPIVGERLVVCCKAKMLLGAPEMAAMSIFRGMTQALGGKFFIERESSAALFDRLAYLLYANTMAQTTYQTQICEAIITLSGAIDAEGLFSPRPDFGSLRAGNALRRSGISDLRGLSALSFHQLGRMEGLGHKSRERMFCELMELARPRSR